MKNLFKTILIISFLLIKLTSSAQDLRRSDLIPDEQAFSTIPRMPKQMSGTKSLDNVPLAKDFLRFSPTQSDQGDVLSCVSWATTYYAYAIQYAIKHNLTDQAEIDRIALSPMYPYQKLVPECSSGMNISKVAEYLKVKGNVTYQTFPARECRKDLPVSAKTFVPIKDFQAVFDPKKDVGQARVDMVLQAIAFNDMPVIVGMEVREKFARMTAAIPYYDPTSDTGNKMLHAMTVIGYDMRRKAFKVLNSWGREWGEDGSFWIKFDHFSKITNEAIVLILPEETQLPEQVAVKQEGFGASFGFQYLDKKTYDFIVSQPHHAGQGIYELDKKDWKVSQAFQLLTNNKTSGLSMCVFGLDDQGKINLLWPEIEKYGLKVSNRLPNSNFDMILPGPDDAIGISKPGTDHMVVLYSTGELLGALPAMLKTMENTRGDVLTRLRAGLGDRLIGSKDIRYDSGKMQLTATPSHGDTVPLILKIQSVPN